MDFLLEYDYIEWQGSLRSTYNKYFHPDVLDYSTEEMWEMIAKGEVQNLFQFTTDLGKSMAMKAEPRTLPELASANSLMRLSTNDPEQPIDRFVRFKNDMNEWYQECKENGLTDEEIETLEPHLLPVYGQANTQEDLMEMLMNEKIANFSITEADNARKGLARKIPELIRNTKTEYFRKGRLEAKATENLLNYVWTYQIEPQLGYSFSRSHTTPYSAIALQELNIAYHYPKIFWETACLIIDSGAIEIEGDGAAKQTEYGKVARAIATMTAQGTKVLPPDINRAAFSFIPDVDNSAILFGLKGVHGIGDDVVEEIINNRPYRSLDDFLEKNVYTGSVVKRGHVLQLIKSGAFDEVEGRPRFEIMKDHILDRAEPRERLTMQNLDSIIDKDIIPEDLHKYGHIYLHRKLITSYRPYKVIPNLNPKLKKKIDDKYYHIKGSVADYFLEVYSDDCVIETKSDGSLIISSTAAEREYNKLIEPLREYVTGSKELLDKFNQLEFEAEWEDRASGGIGKWEMDSLSYYYTEHELHNVDRDYYSIVSYDSLEANPEPTGWNSWRGRKFPKYKVSRIAGTVLDKNDAKHSVTILTPDNEVVNVKFYGGAYSHYNKQIREYDPSTKANRIVEPSWFTRGNKLLLAGYREEDQFRPKVYSDSIFPHTVALIHEIHDNGRLEIQSERVD